MDRSTTDPLSAIPLQNLRPGLDPKRSKDSVAPPGTEVEHRKRGDLGHGFGLDAGTGAEGRVADAAPFWAGFMTSETDAEMRAAAIAFSPQPHPGG